VNEFLRPYLAITRAQLVGLLSALGEYAIRVGLKPWPLDGKDKSDPEIAWRCCAVVAFYWWDYPRRNPRPPGEFVFDEADRRNLARHKYVGGNEGITKEETVRFLEALGRYTAIAHSFQQYFGEFEGHVRAIHAHNALLSFRERPFTQEEFIASVHAVVRGDPSLVTP